MEELISKIFEHLEKNEIDTADALSCDLLDKFPQNPEAHHIRGLIFARSNRLQEALQEFLHSIKINPHNQSYHKNAANAYKLLGNFEQAMLHINEALRIAPNDSYTHSVLGSYNYSRGRIEDAIVNYQKAIRLAPNNTEAHYNLANCLVKLDRLEEAKSHYIRTLELNSGNIDAKLNLAMVHIGLEEYIPAKDYLEDLVKIYPDNAQLNIHLADCYLELGHDELAIAQYNKVLEFKEQPAYCHHNLAILYLNKRDRDKALIHFKAAYNLNPKDITAQHMIAALTGNNIESNPKFAMELFDQYAHSYTHHMMETLQFKVPKLLREAYNTLDKKIHDTNKKILDLGCGTGLAGVLFADTAKYLVGVDISYNMLTEANKIKGYDLLCQQDIISSFPGMTCNFFDLIIACDVFCYTGTLLEIFENIKGALSNNGLVLFSIELPHSKDCQKWQLSTSGRYQHSLEYIRQLSAQLNLNIIYQSNETLRINDGEEVDGAIFILSNN